MNEREHAHTSILSPSLPVTHSHIYTRAELLALEAMTSLM